MDPVTKAHHLHLTDLDYVRQCGHHFKEYEKCVEGTKKKVFEECYVLHYQKFINCYEELKVKGY
jgi:hypothetical protein